MSFWNSAAASLPGRRNRATLHPNSTFIQVRPCDVLGTFQHALLTKTLQISARSIQINTSIYKPWFFHDINYILNTKIPLHYRDHARNINLAAVYRQWHGLDGFVRTEKTYSILLNSCPCLTKCDPICVIISW